MKNVHLIHWGKQTYKFNSKIDFLDVILLGKTFENLSCLLPLIQF